MHGGMDENSDGAPINPIFQSTASGGSNYASRQQFWPTSPSDHAKMLMTGISSMGIHGSNTQMMKAKNNLKMMSHN
tara:strand:+ start:272 stop:499 length:228 start_codon:yes stop_codon:yes gene_type:complete